MSEIHVYPPSPEFVKRAHVKGIAAYHELYERAKQDPPAFWADIARKELTWFKDFDQALEWEAPFAKWFVGGKINASYNCLDRHLATPRKNKAAIIFEGEPGDQRFITYQELHRLVCRFATVLKNRGLKAGDRAIIYMPMIPELPVRLNTITSRTCGASFSDSSTASFRRTSLPRRQPPSAVITTVAPRSSMRAFYAPAEKPPKTTLWMMPSRAHASSATGSSGIIGM